MLLVVFYVLIYLLVVKIFMEGGGLVINIVPNLMS